MTTSASMNKRASEILAEFQSRGILEARHGPDTEVDCIVPVERAGNTSLVFVADADKVERVFAAAPSAVVTTVELAEQFFGLPHTAVLTSKNVKLAHALLRQAYVDRDVRQSEWGQIHESAVVHESAQLADDVVVGPGVVIGRDVCIDQGSVIMANAVIEEGVSIGASTVIHSNVVIGYDCEIGSRVIVKAGCIVGMEGFGFAEDDKGKRYRIPQLGKVVIEDDVVLGANCNIDRATYDETRIGAGCKFDALCHIAHNVVMDEDCVIVAQTGVAGSVRIGKRVIISGQAAITDHVSIADDVALVHRAGVMSDVEKPGVYAGIPIQPMRDYFKNIAVAHRLVELRKRLQDVEKRLAQLTDE